MQSIKVMSLLPLLVCFSCPRILIHLFSSMLSLFFNVASSLSMSMSNLYFFVSISPKAFISLYNLSPLSLIFIKGVLLIDAKIYIWGRRLRFECCIFYGHHLIVGMTPLVALEIPHIESSTLIPICGTPPPMS